jgi:MFS family permease
VILCGSGSGGFFSLQSSVVAQVIGNHRLTSGISWLEVAESFGYLVGPISAGALFDAFGGVDIGAGPFLPAIVRSTLCPDLANATSMWKETPLRLHSC